MWMMNKCQKILVLLSVGHNMLSSEHLFSFIHKNLQVDLRDRRGWTLTANHKDLNPFGFISWRSDRCVDVFLLRANIWKPYWITLIINFVFQIFTLFHYEQSAIHCNSIYLALFSSFKAQQHVLNKQTALHALFVRCVFYSKRLAVFPCFPTCIKRSLRGKLCGQIWTLQQPILI